MITVLKFGVVPPLKIRPRETFIPPNVGIFGNISRYSIRNLVFFESKYCNSLLLYSFFSLLFQYSSWPMRNVWYVASCCAGLVSFTSSICYVPFSLSYRVLLSLADVSPLKEKNWGLYLWNRIFYKFVGLKVDFSCTFLELLKDKLGTSKKFIFVEELNFASNNVYVNWAK